MRISRPAIFLLSLTSITAFAQQSALPPLQRDPQALAVLQKAVLAMGGSVPSDSTANGTVTTVAGSLTENGTIVIVTRGTDQTSEQIQTPHASTIVYSKAQASKTIGPILTPLSLELAATSRSPVFPLPLFAAVLNNPDSSFVYVGLESQNGLQLQHLRCWNSFSSQPKLQFLAEFTLSDIWIDSTTSLPHRLSYVQRSGRASEPRFAVDVYFSNYKAVGGVAYPFLIKKSVNGTPVMTITISSVTFNTGLTDANFPVQ